MPFDAPFKLLEINVISAKDLAPAAKSMKTFLVAWIDPQRKFTSAVDKDGQTNPTWNEKIVFQIDEQFLTSETASITIEIYTSAWRRDTLIGTVGVFLSSLVPPSLICSDTPRMRLIDLQIRRPSGRPQGVLNVGVTLLDSNMKSMPIYSDLSASAVDYWNLNKEEKTSTHKDKNKGIANKIPLLRNKSQKIDSDTCNKISNYNHPEIPSGSACNDESVRNGSELISDVGPSPSVVAAAIAKGMYPIPKDMGSSILEDWTEEESTEGLKTKIERWRSEHPTAYEHDLSKFRATTSRRRKDKKPQRRKGGGLFSCFGTAYGCEFSITCGGGNQKKKIGGGNAPTTSELTFDESYL